MREHRAVFAIGVANIATMPYNQTVERAIDMLECFCADTPEMSVNALAAKLGVDKSAASRLAATLRNRRFLQLDATSRRYRVGPRLYELGQLFDRGETLAQVATPHLRVLAHDVKHACHVGVARDGEMFTLCCVESEQQLQVAVQVGERRPLHATAAGKVLLAFGPKGLFEQAVGSGGLVTVGPRTIVDPRDLEEEIARVRRAGFARNHEESARGIGAIAAPIFGKEALAIASVSTVFPLSLVDAAEAELITTQVRAAAERIGKQVARASSPV